MIKHYCDCCESELSRNYVTQRFSEEMVVSGKRVRVDIMLVIDGVSNQGDLCENCLGKFLAFWFPLGRVRE